MQTRFGGIVIAILFFLAGTHAFAQTTATNVLTANLTPGISSPQVITLQKILNADPSTRIATLGLGSLGNETTYFGQLTKNAVIRFQEKYAREVLIPAGLTAPTGYVGPYTREKLNSIFTRLVATATSSSPVSTLPNAVADGANNILPAAAVFLYPSIEIAKQEAAKATLPTQPVLASSSPATADTSTIITVTGSQFDPVDNTINSTLGQIKHIPSSQGKIQFSIADFPEVKKFATTGFPQGMPISYGVQTAQGISVNYGKFTLSSSAAAATPTPLEHFSLYMRHLFDVFSGAGRAFAYGRLSDGGTVSSIKQICYCSGGTEIQFNSYVDHSNHTYFYSLASTQLYANFNIFTPGSYFLTTLFPVGICTYGSYCSQSDYTEGTLLQTGTS